MGESLRSLRVPSARTTVVVAMVAVAVYVYAWMVQPGRPELGSVWSRPGATFVVHAKGLSAVPPALAGEQAAQAKQLGWYGHWYDQYHYGQMARALARFDLPGTAWDEDADEPVSGEVRTKQASYAYGLGYPLLAVPFVWAGFGGDPFVVVNGVLFALVAVLTLRIARQFVSEPAAIVSVLALVTATPMVRYFVIPFGSSVTVVAVLAATWIAVAPRVGRFDVAFVAASVAVCAAARYVDAAWPVLIIVAAVALRRPGATRVAVVSAVSLTVAIGLVAWTHDLAFGAPWLTPYHFHNDGFDASAKAYALGRIPSALVGVFLSGQRKELFNVDPILRSSPWFALAPIGLVALVRKAHPLRGPILAVAGVALLATLHYGAWFFGGLANLRLWNIRFYEAWFPLAAVLAAVALEWLVGTSRPAREERDHPSPARD
jgi:hypothetical protein